MAVASLCLWPFSLSRIMPSLRKISYLHPLPPVPQIQASCCCCCEGGGRGRRGGGGGGTGGGNWQAFQGCQLFQAPCEALSISSNTTCQLRTAVFHLRFSTHLCFCFCQVILGLRAVSDFRQLDGQPKKEPAMVARRGQGLSTTGDIYSPDVLVLTQKMGHSL